MENNGSGRRSVGRRSIEWGKSVGRRFQSKSDPDREKRRRRCPFPCICFETARNAQPGDHKQNQRRNGPDLPFTGKLKTVDDTYTSILWPAAVGQADSYVLFSKPTAAYTQNSALDKDRDGHVIKAEAAAEVRNRLKAGRSLDDAG